MNAEQRIIRIDKDGGTDTYLIADFDAYERLADIIGEGSDEVIATLQGGGWIETNFAHYALDGGAS